MNLKAEVKKEVERIEKAVFYHEQGKDVDLDKEESEATTRLLKLFRDGFMEIVGDDEISKARPDKLRQSPPWQRNQFQTKLRTKITEATK